MIINAFLMKKNMEWIITLITDVAEVMTMLKAGIGGVEDGDKLNYNIFLYFPYFNFYCIRIRTSPLIHVDKPKSIRV